MSSTRPPRSFVLLLPELVSLLFVLLCLCGPSNALTAADWRSRRIYQLITDRFSLASGLVPSCDPAKLAFCGGSWQGIINRLDYIQGMGFDAIWISPVSLNINETTAVGQGYHGYWVADMWQLQEDAASLTALSNALHNRGMALMVDIVVNDVAFALPVNTSVFDPTVGQSSAGAGDGTYGPLYKPEYYHTRCDIDYTSETSIENCWLQNTGSVLLPDLNTDNADVKSLLYQHVTNLVSTYNIDGIRIDAVKHVPISFWPGYQQAAGVFAMGEVLQGDPMALLLYQNNTLNSVLNYAMYYPLIAAFSSTSGSIVALNNMIGTVSYYFPDSTVLGGFVSNHDLSRPRSITTDNGLLRNLYAFSFVADGIPIWYYGDEQGAFGAADPYNRQAIWLTGERTYDVSATFYIMVAQYNAIRKAAGDSSLTFYTTKNSVVTYNSNDIVMSKYPIISVLTNRGASQSGSAVLTFATSYTAGSTVVETLTCTTATVSATGTLTVAITSGLPQIYLPAAAATGVCPSTTPPTCAQKRALRTSS